MFPNIPWLFTLLLSNFPDLLARQALVVPVVPLADGLGDFHLGLCPNGFNLLRFPTLLPRQSFFAANL